MTGAGSRPPRAGVAESNGGAAALRRLEYVVVDVETTGGSARKGHRVTEIAAVRVDADGQVLDEFCTLVNPERPISRFVVGLTGISDAMVRDAPRFVEIADRVRTLLEGRVFVAHNASFDWRFVQTELERAARALDDDSPRLCTVRLARRLVPEVDRRSLDVLTEHFGIANEARHRALGDARATAELFGRLVGRLEAHGVRFWHEVEAVLARRRRLEPLDEPTLWQREPEEA